MQATKQLDSILRIRLPRILLVYILIATSTVDALRGAGNVRIDTDSTETYGHGLRGEDGLRGGDDLHGGGGLRRQGRRMLTRDLKFEEIFDYWRTTHGKWDRGVHDGHVAAYQARLSGAGRDWAQLPESDEQLLDAYYFLRNRTEVPHAPGWTPERDRCPATCRVYGTCDQEHGRCDCPRGRQGPDCSEPLATSCRDFCQHDGQCFRILQEWCINQCNDRGTCISGVCHCYPGYYGADCSLSLDWGKAEAEAAGAGAEAAAGAAAGGEGGQAAAQGPRPVILAGLDYQPNPRGPRIYVYEFPPQYTLWTITWLDRPLNIIFWERIISLGLRVTDPEQADYFFMPGCGRGCNRWDKKFEFIMAHYGKYWNRSQGRDHLMTHAGDWGRCESFPTHELAGRFAANVTLLHHWGITVDRSKEVEHQWFIPCHKPNQDIHVPVLCGDLYTQFEANVWHPRRRFSPVNKTVLASVAGSICAWNSGEEPPCPNRYYSLGVRAALWNKLRGRPGFSIAKRVPALGQSMAESEFCFAPTGAGHGKRNVMAVTLGCMPVIISDHVAQPFEPFLNWNDFGVWIAEAHVGDVEAILRGFTREQKAAKMEKLRCAARHVAYTSVFGGLFEGDSGHYDAIATTIHILRARLRHPGTPDHELMQADLEFADFMACRSPGGGANSASASAASPPPPPAPPLPAAAAHALHRPSVDDAAFPARTVTTAAWVAAAGGAEGAGADNSLLAVGGGAPPRSLCTFNKHSRSYTPDFEVYPPEEEQFKYRPHGTCMPKNKHRPGGFFPGGSVACPPTGPVTRCERLV